MKMNSIDYYLALPYKVEVIPEEDDAGFTALLPDLPGCMTSADTLDELWPMIEEAKQAWIEAALEEGDHVPEPAPTIDESYSGKFVLRLPRSLHRQLAILARAESTSLNQLLVAMLAEGVGRQAAGSNGSRSDPDPNEGAGREPARARSKH